MADPFVDLDTQLVILVPFTLTGQAWNALLSGQPGIRVVGAATNLEVLSFRNLRPPVAILIDLPTPRPEWIRSVKEKLPDAGFLALVESYGMEDILSLLRGGVTGVISKDEPVGDLARAIIAVGRGEFFLPPEVALQSLAALAREQPGGRPSERGVLSGGELLSEREDEVLRLLAKGYTNKDIAQTLVLSVRTIEAHLRNIYGKLAVSSRTEAVLWVVRHGYGLQD